jgi:hypothetical protein
LIDLLKRIASDLRLKASQRIHELACLCSNSLGTTSVEENAAESAKILYVVNLTLLASLFLLSPDKIPYMLGSNQSVSGIVDALEEIMAIFRRAIPF